MMKNILRIENKSKPLEFNLFDLISLQNNDVSSNKCKIHLAGWNGTENPLDEFFEGRFQEWQEDQTKRNFERDFIISLIQMPEPDTWIFVGIYQSYGCKELADGNSFIYKTELTDFLTDYIGRLLIKFKRSGRQAYLNADRWAAELIVCELRPTPLKIAEFPGYSEVRIKKKTLDTIIKQQIPSWKSALSNVSGIYLITDMSNGKLYIGKASGEQGIWQRWASYSTNGHGENKDLKKILLGKGPKYANNFQYSILEIADSHASEGDILRRESHWKSVLVSREFGYNKN